MKSSYKISSGPHIHSRMTIGNIYIYLILALLPSCMYALYAHEFEALKIIGITTCSAVVSEYLFQLIFKKTSTIGEFHSVYIGIILALHFPAQTPWWLCVIGGVFSVLIFKPMNLLQPVAATKMFLMIIFGSLYPFFSTTVVTVSKNETFLLYDLLIGNTIGPIGTTSVIAILLGAAFLIVMEVLDIRIPMMCILSFLMYCMIFSSRGLDVQYLVSQLCSGTFMFDVWFLAPDYRTVPITKNGRVVYGILLGILIGIIRIHLGFADGILLSILMVNLMTPLIEKLFKR